MHEYDYLLSHHTTIFYISSKQEQSATKFTLPAISAAPPQMSNWQPCLTSIYSRSVVAVVPPAGAAWLAAARPCAPYTTGLHASAACPTGATALPSEPRSSAPPSGAELAGDARPLPRPRPELPGPSLSRCPLCHGCPSGSYPPASILHSRSRVLGGHWNRRRFEMRSDSSLAASQSL